MDEEMSTAVGSTVVGSTAVAVEATELPELGSELDASVATELPESGSSAAVAETAALTAFTVFGFGACAPLVTVVVTAVGSIGIADGSSNWEEEVGEVRSISCPEVLVISFAVPGCETVMAEALDGDVSSGETDGDCDAWTDD